MNTLLNPTGAVRDAVLLIARLIVGVVLIAHGWQKFFQFTIPGTTQSFAQMGVPLPGVAAPFAAIVELVGGILIILGTFTPIVSLLVALVMAGAAFIVHLPNGIFAMDNGWELVGVIAAAALAIGFGGPGRWSVDEMLTSRRTAGRAVQDPARGGAHAAR